MTEGRQSVNQWTLDKHINIGHLLMTAGMIASVLWWGSEIEKRMAVNEVKIETAAKSIEVLETRIISELKTQNASIGKLDDKIQRLIEKGA
jgi:hypothetical protein